MGHPIRDGVRGYGMGWGPRVPAHIRAPVVAKRGQMCTMLGLNQAGIVSSMSAGGNIDETNLELIRKGTIA